MKKTDQPIEFHILYARSDNQYTLYEHYSGDVWFSTQKHLGTGKENEFEMEEAMEQAGVLTGVEIEWGDVTDVLAFGKPKWLRTWE